MNSIVLGEPKITLITNSDPALLTGWGYGSGRTPVGRAVVVWSDAGIMGLWFGQENSATACQELLRQHGLEETESTASTVEIKINDDQAQQWLDRMFSAPSKDQSAGIPVVVKGSAFDHDVWQGLCRIPLGEIWSYGELARSLGRAGAARAVGSALARNQVAFLIPCHRVVRQNGEIGQFRWGSDVKSALIDWEAQGRQKND